MKVLNHWSNFGSAQCKHLNTPGRWQDHQCVVIASTAPHEILFPCAFSLNYSLSLLLLRGESSHTKVGSD